MDDMLFLLLFLMYQQAEIKRLRALLNAEYQANKRGERRLFPFRHLD